MLIGDEETALRAGVHSGIFSPSLCTSLTLGHPREALSMEQAHSASLWHLPGLSQSSADTNGMLISKLLPPRIPLPSCKEAFPSKDLSSWGQGGEYGKHLRLWVDAYYK